MKAISKSGRIVEGRVAELFVKIGIANPIEDVEVDEVIEGSEETIEDIIDNETDLNSEEVIISESDIDECQGNIVDENQDSIEEIIIVSEPKKRGRKPKV